MIALIDYGAGNLTSVKKALAHLGASVHVPRAAGELEAADALIVPGVGHFDATAALDATWRRAILAATGMGRPLLGICLGMQWLFEGSDEAPGVAGLALLPGWCTRLDDEGGTLKVPHVGWNRLHVERECSLLDGTQEGDQVYFTHSYAAPVTGDCIASTTHGAPFASIVARDQIAGVQFHPEKSGQVGLRILGNFLATVRG